MPEPRHHTRMAAVTVGVGHFPVLCIHMELALRTRTPTHGMLTCRYFRMESEDLFYLVTGFVLNHSGSTCTYH